MTRSYLIALLLGVLALAGCGDPSVPGVTPVGDGGTRPSNNCVPNPETDGLEACNGRDDDCDGDTDESPSGNPLRQSCEGMCGGGTQTCADGEWGECDAPEPAEEVCNGVDDDCNGMVDEVCDCVHGETRPCGSDVGACRKGLEQCVEGTWTGECRGEVRPADMETCNNGIDDDCNDMIDEGCQCMPDETQPCGTDVGECVAGEIVCGQDARWGDTCEGETAPETEQCNGLDDDCDGTEDWTDATGFGWAQDHLETNDDCFQGVSLPTAVDGAGWIEAPVDDPADLTTFPTLYPPGQDEDWYNFRADEVSHGACVPLTSQCAFVLVVQLALSDPALRDDFEVCVTTSECGMANQNNLICSNPGRWVEDASSYALAIKWGGTCGRDDSRDVNVVVRSKGSASACGYYQLYARFAFDPDETCP